MSNFITFLSNQSFNLSLHSPKLQLKASQSVLHNQEKTNFPNLNNFTKFHLFSSFSMTVRTLTFARPGLVKSLSEILNPLLKWQSVASFDDKLRSFNSSTRSALKEERRAAVRDFHGRCGASADRAHDTPQVSALVFCLFTKLLKALRKSNWST